MKLFSIFILIAIAATPFHLNTSLTHISDPNLPKLETLNQTSNSFTTLYVSPGNLTNLPIGSYFSIGIQVSNASSFFGWDVSVQTDPSIIAPVAMNFTVTPDLFTANFTVVPTIVAECINGTLVQGPVCGTPYTPGGPGIAHLAAAVFPPPKTPFPPPVSGLLFNITYKVVASTGFSTIEILNNATLTNGSSQGLFPSLIGGTYGTSIPYFSIGANPTSPIIPEGSEGFATIALMSHYHFSGQVSLTLSVPSNSGLGTLGGHLDLTVLDVLPDRTNATILRLNATTLSSSSAYPITITGSSSGGPGFTLTISVFVQQLPYFEMQISPALLLVHAGQSTNTTVLLQSEVGFSGQVNFTLQAPSSLGVTASLSAQNATIHQGGSSFTTLLYVSTPVTSLPFVYRINLTATGMGGTGPIYVTQQLTIRPPPVSLLVSVNPSTVTVRAGESTTAAILVTSVDYFWGFLYASAVMSGGAASFNSSIYYVALPSSPHTSFTPAQSVGMTLKIDLNTPPGNYIVLLTVYSLPASYQRAFSIQVPIEVAVSPPLLHAANQVFGISSWIYFTILAALAIPLVVFSIQIYRRREIEDEEWRA